MLKSRAISSLFIYKVPEVKDEMSSFEEKTGQNTDFGDQDSQKKTG